MLLMKHAGQFNGNGNGVDEPERDRRDISNCSPDISSDGLKNVNSEDGLITKMAHRDIEEYILQGAVPKHVTDSLRSEEDRRNSAEERRLIQQLSKDEYDEDHLMQQVSMLQLKLDESRKNAQTEREYVFCFLAVASDDGRKIIFHPCIIFIAVKGVKCTKRLRN